MPYPLCDAISKRYCAICHTAKSMHHPHKIDDRHRECKTGGGADFALVLGSDNSHTTRGEVSRTGLQSDREQGACLAKEPALSLKFLLLDVVLRTLRRARATPKSSSPCFWDFLAFFPLQENPCFFWGIFPFFPRNFRGSAEKILLFLVVFLANFRTSKAKKIRASVRSQILSVKRRHLHN